MIRFEGITPRNQGTWAKIEHTTGAEAGGADAQNGGGLDFTVSSGGGGAPKLVMAMKTTGAVGIGTPAPTAELHVRTPGGAAELRLDDNGRHVTLAGTRVGDNALLDINYSVGAAQRRAMRVRDGNVVIGSGPASTSMSIGARLRLTLTSENAEVCSRNLMRPWSRSTSP